MKKTFFLFFALFNFSFSYININPTFFDERIDFDGSYKEYTLFNPSKETIKYRIYSESYSKGKSLDMSKWIQFYPRSMTLKPGTSGKIQVNIAAKTKLKPGEYSAILGIRELPLYENVKIEKTSGLGILTDLKLVLNGYAGNISPKLKFSNLKADIEKDHIFISGNVENTGERRGKFELFLDDYFLGNLRIHSKESLDLRVAGFQYKGKFKKNPKNSLVIRDYKTKKTVGIVNF